MRSLRLLGTLAAVVATAALTPGMAAAQKAVTIDLPDSLVKVAKIDEPTARKTAQAKVPRGKVASAELERENGHLQYSYDIKVPGHSGITEVNVDAITGTVLSVHHEGAVAEAKEAAAEAKPKP